MVGGVRKRGKTWSYYFDLGKVEGKRKKKEKGGFRTKKEAESALAAAINEYNNAGQLLEPTEITVHDYLDYWFDNEVKVNLKYNTQIAYLNVIENHLKPAFGQYKLKALSAAPIQQFANQLKLNGLAKNTILNILCVLSDAMNYAVEPLQYIPQNPVQYVKLPKIEKEPRKRIILDMEDWNRIIQRFPFGSRYHIMLQIGFHTGLRISEVCALTWDDIDFKNNTLTVNKQTVKRNFGLDVKEAYKLTGKKELRSSWYFQTPKTKTSNRTIEFGNTLSQVLKEERQRQWKNESLYGEHYTIHVVKNEVDEKGNKIQRIMPIQKGACSSLSRVNLICVDENGYFTSSDSFKFASRVIHRELLMAFDFHSLRHTHATKLIEAGVSPKTVQERLGHTNIETTLQTYVHNTDEMKHSAVTAFENAINQ
ncbi:MAG: tyrosine-type recombinase/integrase [Lachnospiraceae bacterium]